MDVDLNPDDMMAELRMKHVKHKHNAATVPI